MEIGEIKLSLRNGRNSFFYSGERGTHFKKIMKILMITPGIKIFVIMKDR